MAGTYPTTPEFASVGFSSEQATITSTTDSGKMFAVQIDGQRFKFSASYKGDVSGTVTVSGSHSAGDTTIDITGITGTLKAGDFIKFGGHSKVYLVVEDATGDSSTDATITIEPPLRSALSNAEGVTYDDVQFTVRLTNDVQEFNTGDLDLYRFEVDFIEAL